MNYIWSNFSIFYVQCDVSVVKISTSKPKKIIEALSRCSAEGRLSLLQTSACVPSRASWRWGSRPGCPSSRSSICWCRCKAPWGLRGCRTPRYGRRTTAACRRWVPGRRPGRNKIKLIKLWYWMVFSLYIFHSSMACNASRLSKYCHSWQNVWLSHWEPLSRIFGIKITDSNFQLNVIRAEL